MQLSRVDHSDCLRACADPRATQEEKKFLSNMASQYACNESVSEEQYLRVQALTDGAPSTTTSIFNRTKTAS